MSKWNKLFGLKNPEAYGKIEDPPKKEEEHTFSGLYITEYNCRMLQALCYKFDIDSQAILKLVLKDHE